MVHLGNLILEEPKCTSSVAVFLKAYQNLSGPFYPFLADLIWHYCSSLTLLTGRGVEDSAALHLPAMLVFAQVQISTLGSVSMPVLG